jgi:predicted nucleotidyltransferase
MDMGNLTPSKLQLPIDQSQLLAILRAHHVSKASVFGSFARGDFTPQSDLDLLVEFKKPVSLFDEIDLQQELETSVGRKVDLVTHIHPVFEPYIKDDLIPLPL